MWQCCLCSIFVHALASPLCSATVKTLNAKFPCDLQTLNQCVSAGNLDYTEYQTSLGDFRDDAAICNEPLIAGLTHSEVGLMPSKTHSMKE